MVWVTKKLNVKFQEKLNIFSKISKFMKVQNFINFVKKSNEEIIRFKIYISK